MLPGACCDIFIFKPVLLLLYTFAGTLSGVEAKPWLSCKII